MAGRQGWNLRGASHDRAHMTLENHSEWRGDNAQTNTKRERARRRYPLGDCVACGNEGVDRHHRDGNTGNNSPENIAILCRRCHMAIDGRLAKLGHVIHPPRQAGKPCQICRRIYKPLRNGRCAACEIYLRRTGQEWTPSVRTTKKRHVGPIDMLRKTN